MIFWRLNGEPYINIRNQFQEEQSRLGKCDVRSFTVIKQSWRKLNTGEERLSSWLFAVDVAHCVWSELAAFTGCCWLAGVSFNIPNNKHEVYPSSTCLKRVHAALREGTGGHLTRDLLLRAAPTLYRDAEGQRREAASLRAELKHAQNALLSSFLSGFSTNLIIWLLW